MSSNAHLVLLTGSQAGLVAPILPGYYLVGRSSRCQIRPKTRSVSRQHCLLYFGSEPPPPIDSDECDEVADASAPVDAPRRMHVVDLGSTSGTCLNGKRIPVRQWRVLATDCELRCGKIAWRVMVNAQLHQVKAPMHTDFVEYHARGSTMDACNDSASVAEEEPPTELSAEATGDDETGLPVEAATGTAWQEDTVVAFLASQDEVDRKKRRETIRQTVQRKQARSNEFGLTDEARVESVPVHELETLVAESPSSEASSRSPKKRSETVGRSKNVEGDRRESFLPSFHPNWGTVKLALALALTIAVIGFGIYRIIQFQSGPPVRVFRGIGFKMHKVNIDWVG